MMTSKQYRKSLRALNLNVYLHGAKVERIHDDAVVQPFVDATAMTYDMAGMPEHEETLVVYSHLTGSKINRFNHIPHSDEDRMQSDMLDELFGISEQNSCRRCEGMKALGILFAATKEPDSSYDTGCHERFLRYLEYIQENDLVCDASVFDPADSSGKSVRGNVPPDILMHAVEEKESGIVIRGTKACGPHVLAAHELLILHAEPTNADDKRRALAFAIPVDAEGLKYVLAADSYPRPKLGASLMDRALLAFRHCEGLCIFDNVFVPSERVFTQS